MSFCVECGTALIQKELENEGLVSYCQSCQVYRFPSTMWPCQPLFMTN